LEEGKLVASAAGIRRSGLTAQTLS
jgi:hypothetical protein